MKPITMYEADDGSIHKTPEAATKREQVLVLIEQANKSLKRAAGKTIDFTNGGGFIQHTTGELQIFLQRAYEAIQFECGGETA